VAEDRHTPGPWSINTDKGYFGGKALIVWGPEGPGYGAVAYLAPWCPPTSGKELEIAEANARLIAFAPDLLKELEKTLRHLEMLHTEDAYGGCRGFVDDCDCDLAEDYRSAKEAIAKAKGQL
jgi:hypothetical protein